MVKIMKNNRDKSPVAEPEQELLGSILSAGLNDAGTAGCPDEESIATVVEGSVSPVQRDLLLKHISACDDCYETYLLTAELRQEEEIALNTEVMTAEEPEQRRVRRNTFFPAKALALAASILIAAVSVYVFYTGGSVPKTAEQLLFKESQELADSTTAPAPVTIEESEEEPKEKRGKGDMEKAGPKPQQPLEKKKKLQPKPKMELARKDTGKKWGKKSTVREKDGKGAPPEKPAFGYDKETATEPDSYKQTVEEARSRHLKASPADKISPKKKTTQMPMTQTPLNLTPSNEIVTATDESLKRSGDKRQAGQQRMKQASFESDSAGTAIPLPLVQMEQLKKRLQSFPNYIPGTELRRLFQEARAITGRVRSLSARDSGIVTERQNARDFVAIARNAAPAFKAIRGHSGVSLYLNMDYFQSRSKPGSVDFQFFSLARAGWSSDGGAWSQGTRLSESASLAPVGSVGKKGNRQEGKNETGLSPGARQRQLQQWNALLPQLPPEYRQLASTTIKYLENSNRK